MMQIARVFGLFALLIAASANAQSYPAKPVRLIVPFAAGSLSDSLGRLLAKELTTALGQQFVVDNKPGASAIIGAEATALAPADGYVLMLTTNTPQAANLSLFKKLPYDPVNDFTPIARIGYYPFVLVVNPTVPAKSVKELVDYAHANPGKLNYATSNSMSLVSAETINMLAHTDLQRVPYKSNPQALTDLMGGEIQLMIGDLGSSQPHIKSGKLRALGVTTAKRTRLAPDLPTIAEGGLANFDLIGWVGIVGPAKMPNDVVKKLYEALAKIIARPEFQDQMMLVGCEPAVTSPEQFGSFIKQQIAEWAQRVKAAKIEPE
jgi:tripartite-type tricarboxylate transporter receptor subunit TctC